MSSQPPSQYYALGDSQTPRITLRQNGVEASVALEDRYNIEATLVQASLDADSDGLTLCIKESTSEQCSNAIPVMKSNMLPLPIGYNTLLSPSTSLVKKDPSSESLDNPTQFLFDISEQVSDTATVLGEYTYTVTDEPTQEFPLPLSHTSPDENAVARICELGGELSIAISTTSERIGWPVSTGDSPQMAVPKSHLNSLGLSSGDSVPVVVVDSIPDQSYTPKLGDTIDYSVEDDSVQIEVPGPTQNHNTNWRIKEYGNFQLVQVSPISDGMDGSGPTVVRLPSQDPYKHSLEMAQRGSTTIIVNYGPSRILPSQKPIKTPENGANHTVHLSPESETADITAHPDVFEGIPLSSGDSLKPNISITDGSVSLHLRRGDGEVLVTDDWTVRIPEALAVVLGLYNGSPVDWKHTAQTGIGSTDRQSLIGQFDIESLRQTEFTEKSYTLNDVTTGQTSAQSLTIPSDVVSNWNDIPVGFYIKLCQIGETLALQLQPTYNQSESDLPEVCEVTTTTDGVSLSIPNSVWDSLDLTSGQYSLRLYNGCLYVLLER